MYVNKGGGRCSQRDSGARSAALSSHLGGTATPGLTEKDNPCPCPGPWYGSCPTMTTLTSASVVVLYAEKTSCGGG